MTATATTTATTTATATATTSSPSTTTTQIQIHEDIHRKLQYFIDIRKIPNIIFHGTYGCGKNTILNRFIHSIYQGDKDAIKNYVMRVNCAHRKGIIFIREELKFFAKANIDLKDGEIFKTIILTNADKLTIDAQSALRRCIELFSHSTRFFILVEDKYKLLKPILSRFCEIYVPEPAINGTVVNLHTYNINQVYQAVDKMEKQHLDALNKEFTMSPHPTSSHEDVKSLFLKATALYEKGYSALDLINYIERSPDIEEGRKYEYLIAFDKVRREFRNEKLLLTFILNFLLFRCDLNLENISFM
jgi:hypothetical protein